MAAWNQDRYQLYQPRSLGGVSGKIDAYLNTMLVKNQISLFTSLIPLLRPQSQTPTPMRANYSFLSAIQAAP